MYINIYIYIYMYMGFVLENVKKWIHPSFNFQILDVLFLQWFGPMISFPAVVSSL